MDRRDFLKTATTAVGVAATEQLLTPMLRAKTPETEGMIYRTLGAHRRARLGDWPGRLSHRQRVDS